MMCCMRSCDCHMLYLGDMQIMLPWLCLVGVAMVTEVGVAITFCALL